MRSSLQDLGTGLSLSLLPDEAKGCGAADFVLATVSCGCGGCKLYLLGEGSECIYDGDCQKDTPGSFLKSCFSAIAASGCGF